MGNYISCTLPTPLIKNTKAARVIFPGGEVRQFRDPTKAAELMLDCPNFFLSNSQSLHIGRRFSPLGADEELENGNVYIMFPMKRLSSIVTAADMALLFMKANSAAKRISSNVNKGRISPESCEMDPGENRFDMQNNQDRASASPPRLDLEGVEGFSLPEYKYRLSMCRSRKPALETIKEEPVGAR